MWSFLCQEHTRLESVHVTGSFPRVSHRMMEVANDDMGRRQGQPTRLLITTEFSIITGDALVALLSWRSGSGGLTGFVNG